VGLQWGKGLHTGGVTGSIPVAPTSFFNELEKGASGQRRGPGINVQPLC